MRGYDSQMTVRLFLYEIDAGPGRQDARFRVGIAALGPDPHHPSEGHLPWGKGAIFQIDFRP